MFFGSLHTQNLTIFFVCRNDTVFEYQNLEFVYCFIYYAHNHKCVFIEFFYDRATS